jgi:DNA-binding NarL/FixJ family response regulator
MIQILCVDDHQVVREGISLIISRAADMQVVATATTSEEAVSQYRAHRPDITLMDLRLPNGTSGVDAIRAIIAEDPGPGSSC